MNKTTVVAIFIGIILGMLAGYLSGILGLLIGFLTGFILPILVWSPLPLISKVTAEVEDINGVTVLYYTRDNKLVPIKAKYDIKRNIIVPVDRKYRNKIVIFPSPEGTMNLHGHRQKIAFVHVDSGATLSPDYLAIVYDLKYKYGADSLGVAFDLDRASTRIGAEKLSQEIETYQQIIEMIDKALTGDSNALAKVHEILGVDMQDRVLTPEELEAIKGQVEERIRFLERAIELSKKYGKPVVFVGGRVYTMKDVERMLGFRVNQVNIMAIKEYARQEVLERARNKVSEYTPIVVFTVAIIAVMVVALIIASHMGGGGAHVPSPGNLLPHVNLNTTNTTGR